MIKYFKYLFMAAALTAAATGCQEDIEDTFSTDPAAPELVNNGSILMTQNTMSESVTWAWSKARFMTGTVSYQLYAQYGDATAVQVGSATTDLSVTLAKTDLYKLLQSVSSIPKNSTFDLSFYVVATDANGSYESTKQLVTVYAYGDAVSPVATAPNGTIVLDVNDPTGSIELLTWEAARLKYNEAITYNVTLSYGDNAAVTVAKDLTATSLTTTVDELNEFVIAAGAPEAEAADVNLTVFAYSETYPDGVPSAPVKINVTTYVATYPAEMYLPGNYQNWDPATAPKLLMSSSQKGLYAGFIDLTTADGSNSQFKFTPNRSWSDGGDFGGEVTLSTLGSGDNAYAVAIGTTTSSANIEVPSGFYHIALNKKLNTLEMVQVKSLGMIGGFNSWGADLAMTYDAAAQTYTGTGTFTTDDEYKFRVNADWSYSIGANGLLATSGDNLKFDKTSGEYKVVLDVSRHPYTVSFRSTTFPTMEYIYMPGGHQNPVWTPASAPALKTANFDGVYTGFASLGGDFKFTWGRNWTDGEYNSTHFSTYSAGFAPSTDGTNINCSAAGYYYLAADVMNGTLTATPITKWGIIGTATADGWNSDTAMTWNADDESWTLTTTLTAGELKFRANDGWDINLGGASTSNLEANGANLQIAEGGTYTIKLFTTRTANNNIYCTLTK